ncbi:2-(1,2-epoxy-1,2-dihydrophenyl)acetyl-CoA isomerase [Pseudomonas sp. ok272]|uniref:enoyl-CoA hydratase/isomerase family protein n=1 Tax=unclassified Pseudomonas TaxID=196821 RepID=UPI0008D59535|nr:MULTISPECIES: enoyl-CoA hydratase/isomerase family protein [unclassified Pseudomonas]SEN42831.1 2-(1,2-epoxy-1,2-dihydrophenyl)acetyl-CoA isomerase [Pseudomonas sp. ok272]SFN25533.1 2-(1,2-epoxy-1,2-dihydrophenyl)acetyl-CoA isomerase [Pseudomonas sp. ok602]
MSSVLRERQGSLLLVTLNRPEALNALDAQMHDELSDAWHEASDPQVRAVVLTGAGRGFCAGADLNARPAPEVMGHRTMRHTLNAHTLSMAALDKPVIAAVNGAAAGAGLSLACAADIRIASSNAKFVPAFVDIGLVPDAGGSWFITRLLGYSRAFAWLASNRRLSAEEALEWGLVSEVLPPEHLLGHALALAEQLASKPGLAVGLTKRLLAQAARNSLAEQLEAEVTLQHLAILDPDRERARAAMLEKLGRR